MSCQAGSSRAITCISCLTGLYRVIPWQFAGFPARTAYFLPDDLPALVAVFFAPPVLGVPLVADLLSVVLPSLLELLAAGDSADLPETVSPLLDLSTAPPLAPPAESESANCFFSPVLKSVSYQPPPFNRKLAADTNLLNPLLPHAGHFTKGASLIFCSASISWPHFLQLYS